MAKKKKKSKAKKKPSTSKLERETLQIQIEDRQNRIEWRKAMLDVIKEDIQLSQEVFQLLQSDKENAIILLEDALKIQTLRNEQIRAAIPEADRKKTDSVNAKTQELSKFLLDNNEKKYKDLEELNTLQDSVNMIESYSVDKSDQKIVELEEICASDDEDKNIKRETLRRRQEEVLRAEMIEIFERKARDYQENCSKKLDKNIEKIVDETRWWKDSGDILCSMKDSLEQKNAAIYRKIKEEKENLKQRKDKALQVSIIVEEQKREIAKLEKRNVKLKQEEKEEAQLLKEQKILVSQRETAKQDLEELSSKLQEYKSITKYNEYFIQNIENKISKAKLLASDLKDVIETANNLITEDLELPLVKKDNEIPQPKNILQNLECLFEGATKLIFESQQK
ncbi:hypothetical protein JTE90_028502 [Oedothorax gibbosus]|uniref:Uncharacterized protein n=1 Tax=Oedothorax gibbosus TaxID=931172 RepID=A0AAV6VW28_9ARAC|nr:hypothetical protein JTE90_028502 [Oedothorax gibbosus]